MRLGKAGACARPQVMKKKKNGARRLTGTAFCGIINTGNLSGLSRTGKTRESALCMIAGAFGGCEKEQSGKHEQEMDGIFDRALRCGIALRAGGRGSLRA